MQGNEEIANLEAKINGVKTVQEEAELILDLLTKFAVIMGSGSKRYTDRLLQLAEILCSDIYKAWALIYHGITERINGNHDFSLKITQQALALFEGTNEIQGLTKAYNNIGSNFFFRGIYPEALKNYSEALQISLKSGDKSGIASSYNNIGIVYDRQGNYPEALENHLLALRIREKLNNDADLAASYMNIGTIYCYQGKYPEALEIFGKVLYIQQVAGNMKNVVSSYNNIGVVNVRQGNYTEALNNYRLALRIGQETDNKEGIATAYNNIGAVLIEQTQYADAISNFLLALEISKIIGDERGILAAYNNLGEVYAKQGNFKEAIINQLPALQSARKIGNKELIKECADYLYKTYKETGDFENALRYYREYHEIEKDLLGEKAQKQLTNLSFQHNLEQKEKETEIERLKNVELKEALEKLKREQLRSEQLFQNQVQDLKSSALQAQMNPHFVFNSLNAIQQFIWEKEPEEATAYLSRFSKLIRAVLNNSRKQYISLEDDLTTLEYYIELEALRFGNKFEYRIECDPLIDKKQFQLPPMIIQPFAENAIIHGLQPRQRHGKLNISLTKKEDEILLITIEDNGIGRDRANEIKMGNGKSHHSLAMELTRERLEKMNGNVSDKEAVIVTDLFDAHNQPAGTRIEIYLPVEYPE